MKLRNLRRSERLRRALKPRQQPTNAVSLDRHPPELVEKIASFLPLADLCNLRFVNRRTNYSTAQLFVRKHFCEIVVEFTYDGLQRLDDIARLHGLSGNVVFGSRVRRITFKQGVWSEYEEWAWREALSTTKTRK